MIKVIAFDMVGVLVTEKDIDLPLEEDRLERLFGDNIDDADYLMNARKIIPDKSNGYIILVVSLCRLTRL